MRRDLTKSATAARAAPLIHDWPIALRNELVARSRRNSSYSLRAFAKSLAMDPSTLAKIMAGKRSVGPRAARSLAARLGWSAFFVGSELGVGEAASVRYDHIAADEFAVMAEWYHYAILELMRTKAFRSDPRWIASSLKISHAEAVDALGRLVRLGMIERTRTGKLIDRTSGFTSTTGNAFSTSAFRTMQKEILEGAIASLEDIPFERRDHSSMTMAIDQNNLAKAKLLIKKFRRELDALLSPAGRSDLDEVYQLAVALFPVTSLTTNKSRSNPEKSL
jgi:hypothetical protein